MKKRKQSLRMAIVADLEVMIRDSRNDAEKRIIKREIQRLQAIERQKESKK